MSLPFAPTSDVSAAAVFVARTLLAVTAAWLLALALNLIGRRFSASLRHRIWSMSMAAAFALPPLVALVPQWQIAHIPPPAIASADPKPFVTADSQSRIESPMPAASSSVPENADRANRSTLHSPQRVGEGELSDKGKASFATPQQPSPLASRPPGTAIQSAAIPKHITWAVWLAAVWLSICLWLLVRQSVALLTAAAAIRRAPLIDQGIAVRELHRLATEAKLRVRPPLRQSGEIGSPICVGCVRPCIVLPLDHVRWDMEQLRATLTHELAHVARRDVLWQMVAGGACALYWFHPLAWVAAWRMRAERELACDDWVLRGGESSTRYARWLVDMASSLTGRTHVAERVGVAMAGPHDFQSRVSAILDTRRRRMALSRRATLLIALAAGVVLVPLAMMNPLAPARMAAAAPATAPAATQPAKDAEGRQRVLRLKFVDATSGEPLAGVHGNYWPDNQNGQKDARYTSDAQGECDLTFTATARPVGFFYQKDNFVEGLLTLGGEFGAAPLTDTYTLRMQHGLMIGGIVSDELGKGVAGVKVSLSFELRAPGREGGNAIAYGDAMTDAQGKWTFGGAPAHPDQISIYAKHRDFVMKSYDHQFGPSQFENLLAKNLVATIKRGVTFTGNVVGPEGKPVPNAKIAPDGFGVHSEGTADAHGHFELHGIEPGARRLAAKAEGYAPQLAEVVVAAGMQPVEIRLEKGRVLRGRVVDAHGKPVPNANVSVDKWRTAPRLGIDFETDADGRFVWNDAPADAVMLSASTRTHSSTHESVTATAGEAEVVLKLAAQAVLRGSVVDDATGKPIEKFSVHVSANREKTGWTMDRGGVNGKYEVTSFDGADAVQIRVSADGYLPLESPDLKSRDDVVQFDARLKKGGGMEGSVLTPDGKPAVGADVVLIEKGAATVENGVLTRWAKTANVSTTTDAAGHFVLPSRTGPMKLMLFHESGWNIGRREANESLQKLPLRAWCRVEGVLMKGGEPWPGQTVSLRPTTGRGDPVIERQYFRYQTVTDSQGRFKIDRVVEGTSEIGVQFAVPMEDGRNRYEDTHRVPLNLKAGENKTGLQIGGTGRPVIAHVIVGDELKAKGLIPADAQLTLVGPPGFVPPANWDSLSKEDKQRLRDAHEQTDTYQQYARRVKSIVAPMKPDGSLRFEDVPAGQYTLHVNVLRAAPDDPSFLRQEAAADMEVKVADMPGGRSDEVLDAGSIELGAVHRPQVGEMAPAFEPADFDKGRLKLQDYRGKYVLLDFWATWCGPCIAEFKHMERLHETYANDPRLVMIGVSVDDRPNEPSKYLLGRKLPWLQGFAGPSAWKTFGIGAIPSVWLIGPDGKIIAKEIAAEDLDQTVKDALAKKP
ncbi:MAG: resA 1 [Massilia sp.]|nr:resA 1 [Massilia sp.]